MTVRCAPEIVRILSRSAIVYLLNSPDPWIQVIKGAEGIVHHDDG